MRIMESKPRARPDFRSDINGLRAWAVVAVILYHFDVPGFGGGFVGVDVFFVISGFLMTGIVVDGLERGEFSLLAFYLARASRILPALIVLCTVLLMLGWWVLLPLDYTELGLDAVFGLAFLSNIKFWRETGYFDAASHDKWLLHTWSLAVEWQFYLLLPLVLLAVWKWRPGRGPVMVVVAGGLLVSLALSVVATPLRPGAAFYLLPARAWEMLSGGLVYMLAHASTLSAHQRRVLEAAGLALIIGATAGFDASSSWPGWRALVPVLGAVGILLAARAQSVWTGHFLAQWLGTRSYSLYLWHWPIVVALTYLDWQDDATALVAGLTLTLVAADLSYRMVESPSRIQLKRLRLSWAAPLLLGGAVVVAALGAEIHLQDGVLGRFSPVIEAVSGESKNVNPRRAACNWENNGLRSPSCIYGGENLSAIVIGDSHAEAAITALVAAVPFPDNGVMQWTYFGCPALSGVLQAPRFWSVIAKGHACGQFIDWAIQRLNGMPGKIPVVVLNRTSLYAFGENQKIGEQSKTTAPWGFFSSIHGSANSQFLDEFAAKVEDTACELAKNNPVYLVRPMPEMGIHVPKALARAMSFGQHKQISISLSDYHQRHALVWAAQDAARDRCGVIILDPLPYLCSDGRCAGTKDGWPLYRDDNHLSEYGNKLLVPMFAKVFERS
jgi:peptidoglycan/LPS O-acetylase OafA/YrhL